jgi:hypothetical protein
MRFAPGLLPAMGSRLLARASIVAELALIAGIAHSGEKEKDIPTRELHWKYMDDRDVKYDQGTHASEKYRGLVDLEMQSGGSQGAASDPANQRNGAGRREGYSGVPVDHYRCLCAIRRLFSPWHEKRWPGFSGQAILRVGGSSLLPSIAAIGIFGAVLLLTDRNVRSETPLTLGGKQHGG